MAESHRGKFSALPKCDLHKQLRFILLLIILDNELLIKMHVKLLVGPDRSFLHAKGVI